MMHKQELNEAFSKLHASEALKKEVLSMKSKSKTDFRLIAKRAAVCAAVLAIVLTAVLWQADASVDDGKLIAVPGVLKVYAYETNTGGESEFNRIEITSEKPILVAQWNPLISASSFALPLLMQLPEDYFENSDITFVLSSEYGGFSVKKGNNAYHNQITVKEGELVYFGGDTLFDALTSKGEGNPFFADILILADGTIAGYGVISFVFQGATCYAYDFVTVCYPPLEGKMQDVSNEYIQQRITECKQNVNLKEVRLN